MAATLSLPPPPADLLRGASLFLDFDGTLVEIAERPDAIRVDDRLRVLLTRLKHRLAGRVAMITGRPAGELIGLLDESYTVAGSHGLELRRADGTSVPAERPTALARVLEAMHDFASATPGILVEDKPMGTALHYRQAPHTGEACIRLAAELARAHRLVLQPGKMMVEVRAGGGDKGSALRRLMAEPEAAGTRPVFIGDDVTDEDGFVAAAVLGGAGILIGEARQTAAEYRLDGVSELLAWLEQAMEQT